MGVSRLQTLDDELHADLQLHHFAQLAACMHAVLQQSSHYLAAHVHSMLVGYMLFWDVSRHTRDHARKSHAPWFLSIPLSSRPPEIAKQNEGKKRKRLSVTSPVITS